MKIIADANIPFVEECFSSIGDVKVVRGREITPAVVADADILLVRSVTKVNADLLSGSKVKFVATATIGFEHIDTEYLRREKIRFASAPGSNANSVAEYIVAALLAIAKKQKILLEGKTTGIVGVGNVGGRVAQKCTALGMKIYLNDPPLSRRTGDAKYLPMEELYNCDFLTLHTPLSFEGEDKTFHLADEKFFNSLKAGCVFLNTSRGGVADTNALKAAIKNKRLKAVALDVWENEPNIDNGLLRLVDIGTPHIAGYSLDGKITGMIMIYNAACEYLGVRPKCTIDDFLPRTDTPEIKIRSDIDPQNVIHDAVREIYTINRDDFNTREILMVPQKNRGRFFDDLRKNYPIRREFHNTTVILKDNLCPLADKLAGIGFKIKK